MQAVEISSGVWRISIDCEEWDFALTPEGVRARQVGSDKPKQVIHQSELLSYHDILAKSVHQMTLL